MSCNINVIYYTLCNVLNSMIKSFKHKGLKQLFEKGITSGVPAQDAERINDRLQAIDTANDIRELDRQIYKLHPLKGDREGYWSITVRANWRITFQFINGDAYILNYEDYH
nr:HigB toxin protein [Providencia sp.]UNJ80207.1 HigB toxin protein [Providencia sp.]